MNDRDDKYYIDLILNGDKAAYSYLVDRYADLVYSIALRMLKNEHDAEDLAQEIFIVAFRSLSSFKGDSRFSTWLYRITYNKAISHIRKAKKDSIFIKEDQLKIRKVLLPGENDQLSEDEKVSLLQNEIKKLTSEEQLLIMLHYFQEQSIEDISKVTSLSVSNVKVKLYRIRKKLKGKLEGKIWTSIPVIG